MQEFENLIYNPKTVQECVEEAERLYSEGDIRQIRELENNRKEIIYWNGDIKYDYFTIKYVPKIFDNSFEKLKALEFRHQIWKFKNGDASVVKCNLQESSFLKEDEVITKGRVYICGKKIDVGCCDSQDNESKLRLEHLCKEIHDCTRRFKKDKGFKKYGSKRFSFMFNGKSHSILKDILLSYK